MHVAGVWSEVQVNEEEEEEEKDGEEGEGEGVIKGGECGYFSPY